MNTAKVIEIRVDHFYFAFLINTLITGTDVPVLLALAKKTVLRGSFACCSRQNECTEKNHKIFIVRLEVQTSFRTLSSSYTHIWKKIEGAADTYHCLAM